MKNNHYELHVHTEESKGDSATSAREMLTQAKSLGCKKIAVTEHGIMTSTDTVRSICEELGMEAVPAVEAYVRIGDSPEGRCHMCLFAKDTTGYNLLGQAVTDSFSNMEQGGFPVMNETILNRYFAKGTQGHGHVIASSACISGVLSRIFLRNSILEKEMAKAEKAIDKLGITEFDDSALWEAEESLGRLEAEIETVDAIAKKKYGRRKKALEKLAETEGYEALCEALAKEEKETDEAVIVLQDLKAEKKELKKQITVLNRAKRASEELRKKAEKYFAILDRCQNNLRSEEELYALAKERALYFEALFGPGNFFVELQYHGMEEEKSVMPKLQKLAKECHLPTVITNDAHMAKAGKEQVRARQIMRSIRNIQNKSKSGKMWEEAGIADSELYLKTEDELREMLSLILEERDITSGLLGRKNLLEQCHVAFSKEPHYPKFPTDGEPSEECLRRKAYEGANWRYPDGLDEIRQKRMEHELDIMCSMGYADYHLIVQDYVRYGKLIGKFDFSHLPDGFDKHLFDIPWLTEHSKGLVGIGVGPGRGSAAGSIVCYVLGITDLDPVTYGLLFERFLNPERVSMPDIDVDFATYLRDYVYRYVAHKYGEANVCHIMTRNRQKAKAAIDNCGKLLGDKMFADTTHFQPVSDKIKSLVVDGEMPSREEVSEKLGGDKNALRIYDDACLVEDTFTFYGMHAAGVVISDGVPIKERVPLMVDSKTEALKTQCDMIQVEEYHNLLKMDFLGLLNLDIITDCLRMVERNYGVSIDTKCLPFEPDVFRNIYGKGFTNGVFQVESPGMKQMMRQAKPKTIEDVIILISMYRPGPMDFLDDMIPVMNGTKKASFLVPELEPILGKTYGAIVYQEQVMEIFQKLAGYSLGGADTVRRFMSKKKMDKLVKEEKAFIYGDESRSIPGCIKRGIPEAEAKTLFGQMTEFAKYAFNKSHAAAYAIVSYQTAWLKYHYPKEYLCVCMSHFGAEKRKGFLADAMSLGIKVLPVDINRSEADFAVKNGNIYYGMKHILNVSSKAEAIVRERRENGEYVSLADFVSRTYFKGNILKNLIFCGAFDKIMTASRKSMAEASELFPEPVKTLSEKRKKLSEPGISEITRLNAANAIRTSLQVLNDITFSLEADVLADNLKKEQELMGIMLSGHPADDYVSPEKVGATPLSSLSATGRATVMGAVLNLHIRERKSDGKKMAFFDLDMPDGTIHACCFSEAYEKFGKFILENAVILCTGAIKEKELGDGFGSEESEKRTVLELIIKTIKEVPRRKKEIILYGKKQSKEEWQAFGDGLKPYQTDESNPNGLSVILYNGNTNRFLKTGLFVTEQILKSSYDFSM